MSAGHGEILAFVEARNSASDLGTGSWKIRQRIHRDTAYCVCLDYSDNKSKKR